MKNINVKTKSHVTAVPGESKKKKNTFSSDFYSVVSSCRIML